MEDRDRLRHVRDRFRRFDQGQTDVLDLLTQRHPSAEVRRAGGRYDVLSAPGGGCTIRIWVPLDRQQSTPAGP